MENQKTCSRCVLDTTVPDITFDADGECNFCKMHDRFEKAHPLGETGKNELDKLITEIKTDGKGKEYDCIIGVSGGRDSTYTLYTAVKLGLRPLAVHFDNGWNSETAVSNIRKATTKLGVDLHTVVADWEEFKDLQRSFLLASTSDADIPTDYAIYSVLYTEAAAAGVRYTLNGHSFRTEGTVPKSWTYMDPRYLRSVHKRFSTKKITSFPIMGLSKFAYFALLKRIRDVRLMEYIDYRKNDVDEILKKELGWTDYGGHHHENIYTHFFQSYYLPVKFGIDKRKVEYSALVRTGQMDRQKALEELKKPYEYDKEIVDYAVSKLGFATEEFNKIMDTPRKTHNDFPTYQPLIKALKISLKIAARMHLIPRILAEKYTA